MPEIRVETVLEFIRHRHSAYTVCPECSEHRAIDLDRMVRLGLGERSVRKLRIRCLKCSTRLGHSVQVRVITPGFRKESERQRPDNVVSICSKS